MLIHVISISFFLDTPNIFKTLTCKTGIPKVECVCLYVSVFKKKKKKKAPTSTNISKLHQHARNGYMIKRRRSGA